RVRYENGVTLPIHARALLQHALEGFPGAVKHRSIHTARYFLEVDARLRPVAKEPSLKGRLELRGIRTELLEGTFPH
ncbi:MAG TPA: hypothetical protein VFK72_09335, partial [Nevskia sp.]|nr:hypothetical protein [Nevskia sp.]